MQFLYDNKAMNCDKFVKLQGCCCLHTQKFKLLTFRNQSEPHKSETETQNSYVGAVGTQCNCKTTDTAALLLL